MDEETVKRQVRQHRALFAIFDFRKGDTIGGQKVDPGGHATVIDGYSSAGPLVVTWGQTYQMTWGEFWRSISSLKVIEP
jgi:hypothetical protein